MKAITVRSKRDKVHKIFTDLQKLEKLVRDDAEIKLKIEKSTGIADIEETITSVRCHYFKMELDLDTLIDKCDLPDNLETDWMLTI